MLQEIQEEFQEIVAFCTVKIKKIYSMTKCTVASRQLQNSSWAQCVLFDTATSMVPLSVLH